MNELSTTSKRHNTFSFVLLLLTLITGVAFPVVGRWGSIKALGFELAWLSLGIIWLIHRVWAILFGRLVQDKKGGSSAVKHWAITLLAFISIVSACILGGVLGSNLRIQEVKRAIDAGLREDCLKLLAAWPVKDDRIQDFELAYDQLPPSIRMLTPVYVCNDRLNDPSVPAHIGLCKNGWGGFAFGIRVFRIDEDAQLLKEGERQRIAAGVYIWWLGT